MKLPVKIIVRVFSFTIIACIIYTVYMASTIDESATIAIPFGFLAVTGIALFSECIILSIIFHKQFSTVWKILLPVFIVTSIPQIYFFYSWYSNRPVNVPPAGQLLVSVSQYHKDINLIINDYLQTEIDSNSIDIYQDTIEAVKIDTIFYSLDKSKFFAIIIAIAKDGDSQKFCAKYRVGRRIKNSWQLGSPKGNIWVTCFSAIEIFKKDLRQYYYKRYSINKSSDRPEIWSDNYIFNF